jgi:hypothetical protein
MEDTVYSLSEKALSLSQNVWFLTLGQDKDIGIYDVLFKV